MADSLRDQLIAAGFEAPKKQVKKSSKQNSDKRQQSKKNHNKKNRPTPNHKGSANKNPAQKNKIQNAEADAAIAERKKLKAQIKELIDNNKLENWKGEVAYRYTVEKRIRELYVNEAAHKHLTDRNVAITRLNGDTYLIPIETANEVIHINPQWSVFNAVEASDEQSNEDDEYAEFQVPDDLQW